MSSKMFERERHQLVRTGQFQNDVAALSGSVCRGSRPGRPRGKRGRRLFFGDTRL